MSESETFPRFGATSAAGAMLRQARWPVPVMVGCMLAGIGTSAAQIPPLDVVTAQRSAAQTSSGVPLLAGAAAGAAIGELRRLSGFTWEQLARLFNVSRRSLHFWASGKPMSPANEEHLQRLLGALRKIDRGSGRANRTELLCAREDGTLPLDLLAAGDYERVVSLLGPGGPRRVSPSRPSEDVRASRAPRPPEELAGALEDRIHPTSGRLRAAKAIPVPRRK